MIDETRGRLFTMQLLTRHKFKQYRCSSLLLAAIMLLLIPACKSGKSEFLLDDTDLQALTDLRNVSDWNFFQDEVKMKVFEGGTLIFTMSGTASHKLDRNSAQLLIPLLLLHE